MRNVRILNSHSVFKASIAVVLMVMMVFSFVGCGSSTPPATKDTTAQQAATQPEATKQAATQQETTKQAAAPDKASKKSVTIKVGSKDFTEQLVLGQITLQALANAGYTVVNKTNVAGSDKCRKALVSGEFDMYWEYTGTGWMVHLQHPDVITNSDDAYNKVKTEDLKNNLVWLNYAPFNNTYTVMMRAADSEKLGITSISQFADYVTKNPGKLVFSGDHEFTVRPDGLPGLQKSYGFKMEGKSVKVMEQGIAYKALGEKQVDAGMGFATDGRIAAFKLVNLKDDKNYFPVYNPAPVVRKELLDKNPDIADILNPISAKLDTDTMIKLNYQVDVEEKDPEKVAKEWLTAQGFLK